MQPSGANTFVAKAIAGASATNKVLVAGTIGGVSKVYRGVYNGGVWAPSDFTLLTISGNPIFTSVASSSDGTRLAGAVYGGGIYLSNDSGATWAMSSSAGNAGTDQWSNLVSSSDGKRLTATNDSTGKTWTLTLP